MCRIIEEYLMREDNIKIALIGPYPPPYGGVSIYIQRLKRRLEEEGIKYLAYDTSGIHEGVKNTVNIRMVKKRFFGYFFVPKENIVHLQCSEYSPKFLFKAVLLALFGKKVIITYHNWRREIKYVGLLGKLLVELASKFISCFIAVGPHIRRNLINLGFNPERIEIIPAYITPSVREEDINAIPENIWNFIDSHSPVISANASRIDFYNNQDRYGIDMCIDLCANLKREYPKIGFVFCLPDIGDHSYFHKMKRRIKGKAIEKNFLFQTKTYQFYPILIKSDVFVRPTNLDGDAISIREALYFKIPSVASDVCWRPEGTILFKSRDTDDFISKIKDVLNNYERYKRCLDTVAQQNNAKKVIEVYQSLCK